MTFSEPRDLRGVTVIRDDGMSGIVIEQEASGLWIVEFSDHSRLVVAADVLLLQENGSYLLNMGNSESDELVIPVIAEEIEVTKQRVERGRVRVIKRIESRQEVIDTPVMHEEIAVERIPINRFVDEAVPAIREEEDLIVIPLVEEVLVVEKRFLLTEEIHISKKRRSSSNPQTVILRREVVDIERVEGENGENIIS
jgi:uncharacterized protein (TIGR02271 family)